MYLLHNNVVFKHFIDKESTTQSHIRVINDDMLPSSGSDDASKRKNLPQILTFDI